MNLDTLYVFLLVLRLFLPFVGLFAVIYLWYPEQTKALYHIRRTFTPLYRRIEEQYGPESYPAIMSDPYCEYFGISDLDHWDYVFFVKDSSFAIMNIHDSSIKGEIPFDSIICADSYRHIPSKRWYHKSIEIYFNANDATQHFRLDALKYSKRLNKKFDKNFSGKKLHDFIRSNFIHYRDSELW